MADFDKKLDEALMTGGRFVVVDEMDESPYAIAFDSEEAALPLYKKLVAANMVKNYGFSEGDADVQKVLNAKSVDDIGEWSEVLLLRDGPIGVWTGFSSADRNSIGGSLPFEDEDAFIGNGDPNFYFTGKVPSGTKVPVISSVEPEVHPLYQRLIDRERELE